MPLPFLPPSLQLPPHVQEQVEQYVATLKDFWHQAKEYSGPAMAHIKAGVKELRGKLESVGGGGIGASFRHLCVVGLNRAELLMQGETQPVFADNWQDLVDASLKRHTAVIFFAPRGLDGNPVNPYLFLVGESEEKKVEEEENAGEAEALAQQTVGPVPLLDFCRMPPSEPNMVNILLAADVLFHWDVKDNYVLPTSPTSWVRDVDTVMQTYPRTTRANLYTQWDTDALPHTERVMVHKLRDLPLADATWLNQPTVQEKYGTHVLVTGLVLTGLVFAGVWFTSSRASKVEEELSVVQQQIPRGGQFSDIEKAISEQEKMFDRREMFALVVKDTALAIQGSDMKADNFEVKVPRPDDPPKQYLITVDAMDHAYQGWLQQEPAARGLILHSSLMDGVRKPPTPTGFKLEGLVEADPLLKKYKQLTRKAKQGVVSGTAVVSGSEKKPEAATGKEAHP